MKKTTPQSILEPAEGVLDKLFLVARCLKSDPDVAREIWDAACKLNIVLSDCNLALKKADEDELGAFTFDGHPGISALWRTHSGENAPWLSNEIGK